MRGQAQSREVGAWRWELRFRCTQIPCSVSPPSSLPAHPSFPLEALACGRELQAPCGRPAQRHRASQTRAQRREDAPRPARDSSVASLRSSGAGTASLPASPLDQLHLWSLGTDTEDFATLSRTLFREGLTCPTVTGGPAASRPSAREAGRPRLHLRSFLPLLNSELGSGGWGKTQCRDGHQGAPRWAPLLWGLASGRTASCHLPGQMAARAGCP